MGIVMRTGAEGLGAGSFLLSCVTAFYDYLGETREGDFFEYPDYYTFQTTEDPADYRMLDIYPDHKNLAVEPDAEHLLQAINDRAITILLVPDGPPTSPNVADIALQSARRRMDSCYVYAPDGRPSDATFSIRQPRRPANEWFEATIESMDHPEEVPAFGSDDDSIHQQFSPVPLERALERLPG
ncbi:hypothetical protein C447_12772 [Halococcus hamelinensis 100A6]|uniref:Uncharacterized protein n=2 Tax=Halococcus hamelinensis TaxID=332168 RepID=M0LY08_9EURY|nr:hypothetical protein [Halococcus hamelinensis]EMA37244.1 hypothetical protein C447_12772 [Halococcus hamelinensis 100A6]